MKLVVDGTGNEKKAPRPRVRGPVQVVYDTIEGLGGAAKRIEIIRYIPAAIVETQQAYTQKQVAQALQNGRYRGYWIHDPNSDVFSIAPISYYQSRQEFINAGPEGKRKRKRRSTKPEKPIGDTHIIIKNNYWLIATVGLLCFIVGCGVGILI